MYGIRVDLECSRPADYYLDMYGIAEPRQIHRRNDRGGYDRSLEPRYKVSNSKRRLGVYLWWMQQHLKVRREVSMEHIDSLEKAEKYTNIREQKSLHMFENDRQGVREALDWAIFRPGFNVEAGSAKVWEMDFPARLPYLGFIATGPPLANYVYDAGNQGWEMVDPLVAMMTNISGLALQAPEGSALKKVLEQDS